MSRANLYRDAYTIMQGRAELVTALGHTLNATTISAGARIIASNVSVFDLPRPCVVIIGLDNPRSGQQTQKDSTLTLEVHGDDVFSVAEVIDELECMCDEFRANEHTLNNTIHKVDFLDDTFINSPDPTLRMSASQVQILIKWR